MGISTSFTAKYTSHRKERAKELVDKLDGGMHKAVLIVERQAKENVSKTTGHPQVQTGRLRASIVSRVDKEGNNIVGKISSNVEYAPYLEFGTIRMPPYPWLFPALEAKKGEVKEALAKGGSKLL